MCVRFSTTQPCSDCGAHTSGPEVPAIVLAVTQFENENVELSYSGLYLRSARPLRLVDWFGCGLIDLCNVILLELLIVTSHNTHSNDVSIYIDQYELVVTFEVDMVTSSNGFCDGLNNGISIEFVVISDRWSYRELEARIVFVEVRFQDSIAELVQTTAHRLAEE